MEMLKTKYMFVAQYQSTGQNHYIKVANKFLESVVKVRYLGTTKTNQNFIHKEIKSRLNSENACYHAVQKLLPSHLLSKNIKIKNIQNCSLPVPLYWCET
jgi:hypothetical protein